MGTRVHFSGDQSLRGDDGLGAEESLLRDMSMRDSELSRDKTGTYRFPLLPIDDNE